MSTSSGALSGTHLRTLSWKIPGLSGHETLKSSQVGIYGHSLGGVTVAQAVANQSSVFPCRANFDGGLYGSVTSTGLDGPFLQIGAGNHAQSNDTTFADFWDHLWGFRREFIVNDTVHMSFLDIPTLRDLLGAMFPAELRNQSGTTTGRGILGIETALMHAFFAFCLGDKPADALDCLARDGRFPDPVETRM